MDETEQAFLKRLPARAQAAQSVLDYYADRPKAMHCRVEDEARDAFRMGQFALEGRTAKLFGQDYRRTQFERAFCGVEPELIREVKGTCP